jgi:hypothetical protein
MSNGNQRHFDNETLNKGQTIISLQYGTNIGVSQSGMTPYGQVRQILPPKASEKTADVII